MLTDVKPPKFNNLNEEMNWYMNVIFKNYEDCKHDSIKKNKIFVDCIEMFTQKQNIWFLNNNPEILATIRRHVQDCLIKSQDSHHRKVCKHFMYIF